MTIENLSIQFVAQVTGINPHTIRAWEKRYQCLTPHRDTNGRRQYNESDVEKLQLLHELVSKGNNISEIAHLNIQNLKDMHERYLGAAPRPNKINTEQFDYHSILSGLLMALQSYRLDVVSHELEKIKTASNPREFALNLMAPLLREIGESVANHYLNMAQEHALSSILRFHTGQILNSFILKQSSLKNTRTMAIAALEGERHEFGILIAALLCCHYKIKFYYLGPDLPSDALADAAKQLQCDTIIVGISKQGLGAAINNTKNELKKLAKLTPDEMSVWAGGVYPEQFKDLPQKIETIPTLQLLDNKLANAKPVIN